VQIGEQWYPRDIAESALPKDITYTHGYCPPCFAMAMHEAEKITLEQERMEEVQRVINMLSQKKRSRPTQLEQALS